MLVTAPALDQMVAADIHGIGTRTENRTGALRRCSAMSEDEEQVLCRPDLV